MNKKILLISFMGMCHAPDPVVKDANLTTAPVQETKNIQSAELSSANSDSDDIQDFNDCVSQAKSAHAAGKTEMAVHLLKQGLNMTEYPYHYSRLSLVAYNTGNTDMAMEILLAGIDRYKDYQDLIHITGSTHRLDFHDLTKKALYKALDLTLNNENINEIIMQAHKLGHINFIQHAFTIIFNQNIQNLERISSLNFYIQLSKTAHTIGERISKNRAFERALSLTIKDSEYAKMAKVALEIEYHL